MNTRKDNHGKAMKAWRATPVGHIAKPLRHIGNRTNTKDGEGKLVVSAEYAEAFRAAKAGDGQYVANMARALL